MKQRANLLHHITPFLVLEVCLFFLSVYALIEDGNSWGGLLGIVGLFSATALLIVDLILKKVCAKYVQTFMIEIGILMVIFIWLLL